MLSWTRARLGQVQTSPWLRANMAKPSSALSKKSSSSAITSAKKMLGDLPPSSSVTGIRFSDAYCMIKRPVVVSPVKATLAMRLFWASGLPASTPKPLTTLSTPGGRRSPTRSISTMMLMGVCSAGFSITQLPRRHQDREVPRDDLADHAERLVIVIGDGVVVELAEGAFLRTDAGREIAEMIDSERNVGEGGLADRLAVVDGLNRGEHLEVLLHAVGDLVDDRGSRRRRGAAPGILGLVRGVERKLDVGGLRARDLAHHLAGDRAYIVEIAAVDRGDPLAADEIVVAGPQRYARIQSLDDLMQHGCLPRAWII